MAKQVQRNELLVDPPRPLIWLIGGTTMTAIVGLVLMAIAFYIEDGAPQGSGQWLVQHGVRPVYLSAYSLIAAALLLIFHNRLSLHRLSGLIFYGVLTSPYPFYCLISTAFIVSTGAGSRPALVAYWMGYCFFFISLSFASLMGTWLKNERAGRG